MKRLFLAVIGIATFCVATAQDRIVFKNTNEQNVKVINVSPETITYKQWGNLEGPTYTVNKSEILFIAYENGTKESFSSTTISKEASFSIKFQGYGNLGLIYCPDAAGAGPVVNVSVGAAIGDYVYAGFETGFNTLFSSSGFYSLFEGYVPLALNLKGYFTKSKVRPFVNVSLGGFVGVADLEGYNGFYCQAGAGVEIKRFSLGLGYNGLVIGGTASSLYFNLGYRFGGKKYW